MQACWVCCFATASMMTMVLKTAPQPLAVLCSAAAAAVWQRHMLTCRKQLLQCQHKAASGTAELLQVAYLPSICICKQAHNSGQGPLIQVHVGLFPDRAHGLVSEEGEDLQDSQPRPCLHETSSAAVLLLEYAMMLPNRRDGPSAALCRDASTCITQNKPSHSPMASRRPSKPNTTSSVCCQRSPCKHIAYYQPALTTIVSSNTAKGAFW